MEKLNIFWFRRDLRLEDNHGFYKALISNEKVLPIFIFDEDILSQLPNKKDRRVDFIFQALQRMNAELPEHKKIHFFIGKPLEIYEELVQKYSISKVFCNEDYEPYAIGRDLEIQKFLEKNNIIFETYKDQVIFHKDEVLKADGNPYTVYTPYSKMWKQNFKTEFLDKFPSEKNLENIAEIPLEKEISLEDLGFEKTDIQFQEPVISVPENYATLRDFPYNDATTRLSVHLRFGTVSVRKVLRETETFGKFWGEVIWREFFMSIMYHFPHVQNRAFKEIYGDFSWKNNEDDFRKWCEGKTGYPIVDAGMRELNATGYMHNRVRMIVASFLIKHLLIDWKWGEAYFAEKLLDFDLALNNGNWQWVAGTGVDASPYYRVFNPYLQQEKFDKEYKYVKKWVPEYNTPSYPKPMIEHDVARKLYLEKLKK